MRGQQRFGAEGNRGMATTLSERLAPGPAPKRVRVAADGRAGTVQMVYYDRLHTGDSYDELTVELDGGGTVRGSAALFESINEEVCGGCGQLLTDLEVFGDGEHLCDDCARRAEGK